MAGDVKKSVISGNKRVNIALDEATHTKAKVISVINGITMNEYLLIAIKKAIEEDKGLIKRAKL